MCGINGIAYSKSSGRGIDRERLIRMRDQLIHRGPDDAGLYIDKNIGLGHRRLSIIDVQGGAQPFAAADGSCVIVYNGEVYDHADRRAELIEKGYEYRTRCDTETILYLYQEFGAECVNHMRGMFAFAIWDARKQQLFLARDRMGVKPLYYVHDNEGNLFFASEIKALIATAAVRPKLNFAVLSDHLANHAPSGGATLFEGVKRLLPGHSMTWADGKLDIRKYWDLHFSPKLNGVVRSSADRTREWADLFRESVKMRLMSDVPLGMFLSGGIDSSAIAAVMTEFVDEPVKTFSVGFAEREANEFEYARDVARTLGTEHYETLVSSDGFFNALPNLIRHEDEPLAHPSSVALFFVSKLASQYVKVVLTGEGSDESLGGYGRYPKTIANLRYGTAYHRIFPEPVRRLIKRTFDHLPIDSGIRHKFGRSFLAVEPTIEDIYFDNFAVFSRSAQASMLADDTIEQIGENNDPYIEMAGFFNSPSVATLLDRMLYADTKTYLHELLMKQDQMSMAASIESRVPFLDHKLMELSARLPDDMKLRGTVTKYVLRNAMKGVLPPSILKRKKMGFPVPIGKWFRGEKKAVIDEMLCSERALSRGLFRSEAVREMIARHDRGEDHAERLWALVNLEIWQRIFIDGEG